MKQSPLFEKMELFLHWLLPITAQFPRHHRFGLVRRLEDAVFDCYEQLIRIIKTPHTRELAFAEADVQLAQLRLYLRLCHEMQLLTPKQYKEGSEKAVELGKLLGGWKKSSIMSVGDE